MTEQEWQDCTDPTTMLSFLRGKASDRQLRLFACACCRRVWHLFTDERSRRAVDQAERAADEVVPDLDIVLREAGDTYPDAITGEEEDAESKECPGVTTGQYVSACSAAAFAAATPVVRVDDVLVVSRATIVAAGKVSAERESQMNLIRDIFRNPFQPVTTDPSWLTSDVLALATGIYADRAFDRMPILGDALQDAGCDNPDILTHCRSEAPHVRGCWVVDLLLGKE